jgi:hypothetical protein
MSEQANKVAIVTAHRAASASGWALRAARVPPMDYRHKPIRRGSLLDADKGSSAAITSRSD